MKISRGARDGLAQRRRARRRLAQIHALVLLIAPFAAVGRAEAQCAPNSPVNNTTVTCTGTTTNATGDGYGTSTDTGNTYNIVTGATVTGASNGLVFDSGTANNSGTITGAGFGGAGILGVNEVVLSNSGTISATGTNAGGVVALGLGNSDVVVNNAGKILATVTGGVGIVASGTATLTNSRRQSKRISLQSQALPPHG